MPPAPLYLRTLWRYTNAVIIIVITGVISDKQVLYIDMQAACGVRDVFPGVGSASELLDDSTSGSQDKLSLLKHKLADLLETSYDNINIIAVRDAADAPGSVDVTYAAHGSPYYTPEKLDAVVSMNRQEVSNSLCVHIGPLQSFAGDKQDLQCFDTVGLVI